MSTTLSLLFISAAVVAGLVFLPLSSYTSVYVVMGAMIAGGVLLRSRLGAILYHRSYVAVGIAFLLFAVPVPFVWQSPRDLLIIVALLPVPLGMGLVALLDVEARFASPLLIGGLSFAGALGAAVAGLNDVYVFGIARAGVGNNPIHYAGLSMTLGFFSLVGLFGSRSPWRLLLLAGPFLGLGAVLLSQTRGAMLGFAIVAAVMSVMFIVWFSRTRLWTIGGLVIGAVAIAGLIVLTPNASSRVMSAFFDTQTAVVALLTEDGQDEPIEGVDYSFDQRLALVRGAVNVFLNHPLFGVGAGQVITEAQGYFPERYKNMGNHLHSDPGDFAAAAGIFGLAGYLLLLLAPFLRPPGLYGEDARRGMLVGAVGLSGSYLTLGMTNAVFGILPQTALFGTLLALLVAMGRSSRNDEQAG